MKRLFIALFLSFFALPALAGFYQVNMPYGKMYLLDRSLLIKFTNGGEAQCPQTDMVTRQTADMFPVNVYQYNCEGTVVRVSVYVMKRKSANDNHVVEIFDGRTHQLEKRTTLNWDAVRVVNQID